MRTSTKKLLAHGLAFGLLAVFTLSSLARADGFLSPAEQDLISPDPVKVEAAIESFKKNKKRVRAILGYVVSKEGDPDLRAGRDHCLKALKVLHEHKIAVAGWLPILYATDLGRITDGLHDLTPDHLKLIRSLGDISDQLSSDENHFFQKTFDSLLKRSMNLETTVKVGFQAHELGSAIGKLAKFAARSDWEDLVRRMDFSKEDPSLTTPRLSRQAALGFLGECYQRCPSLNDEDRYKIRKTVLQYQTVSEARAKSGDEHAAAGAAWVRISGPQGLIAWLAQGNEADKSIASSLATEEMAREAMLGLVSLLDPPTDFMVRERARRALEGIRERFYSSRHEAYERDLTVALDARPGQHPTDLCSALCGVADHPESWTERFSERANIVNNPFSDAKGNALQALTFLLEAKAAPFCLGAKQITQRLRDRIHDRTQNITGASCPDFIDAFPKNAASLAKGMEQGLWKLSNYELYFAQFNTKLMRKLNRERSATLELRMASAQNALKKAVEDHSDNGSNAWGSLFNSYAVASDALTLPQDTGLLKKVDEIVNPNDWTENAYKPGYSLRTGRAAAMRAATIGLSLFLRDPRDASNREKMKKVLENFIQYLPSHIVNYKTGYAADPSTSPHKDDDGIAPYYLLPNLAHAASSVRAMLNTCKDETEKRSLEKIRDQLKHQVLSLIGNDGKVQEPKENDVPGYSAPMVGLALIPLLDKNDSCAKEIEDGSNFAGILDDDLLP